MITSKRDASAFARQRSDEGPRLALDDPIVLPFADDLQHLLDSGPAHVIVQAHGAGQRADFEATMTLVLRGHRLTYPSALTLSPGGKVCASSLEFLLDFPM